MTESQTITDSRPRTAVPAQEGNQWASHVLAGVAGQTSALAEGSLRAWWNHSVALSGRQILVAVRDVYTLIQVLIVPAVSMVMFKVVLGDVIGEALGYDSIYGTVPMVILIGAMFGSIAAATRLNSERLTGLLARLYVLPINRGAELTSRVVAELVRIVVTTLILLVVGYILGFRFTQGAGPAVGLVVVALAYGAAFSLVAFAFAVNAAPGAPIVPLLGLLSSLMMFFNAGFSPVAAYPTWLQPIVANQPMTPAIEVMRACAIGGPVADSLIKTALWTVGIGALAIYPALRGYRKAAVG